MSGLSELAQAIVDLAEDRVRQLVEAKLDAGVAASDIMADCRAGMTEIGARFDRGECFIPELMFAGSIMRRVVDELGPRLKETRQEHAEGIGVVIGTVKGDIHDIGKDIVVMMLEGTGFRVTDLGVDVPPDKFVEAVAASGARVVGMSVFLTSCCKSIGETVEALKRAGLRDKVGIMIGGAAASDVVADRVGCDYYGETAVDAVYYASKIAAA